MVPRRVDHGERRAHIIDAMVRVAAADGLHAVTVRAVAAEAGISLNLVQYYFATKAELLHAALDRLEEQSRQRWDGRLAALGPSPTAEALVEAFVAEALPTDGASRTFHLVWMSYAVLAMTDADLAARPFVAGPDRLERQLTDVFRQAQHDGCLDAQSDPATEAARLLALSHGLGTSVLVGRLTAEAAMSVLRAHLDQLFRPVRPRPDHPSPGRTGTPQRRPAG